MIFYGDIREMKGGDIPPVDCIIGGSPCQDLSVAGKRAGLAGERSGLFMEQIRLVKEMRSATANTGRCLPRFMVWENVPGAFSSNGGEDFRTVLEETARIVCEDAVIPRPAKWSKSGAIMGDGWSIAWRVHNARFWGVPQRRTRIALVADFGGSAATEILFERKSLRGGASESEEAREEAAGGTGESIDGTMSFYERAGRGGGNGILITEGETYALTTFNNIRVFDARGGGDGETVSTITGDHAAHISDYTPIIVDISLHPAAGFGTSFALTQRADSLGVSTQKGVRRLTPLECERLQGFPDGWTDIGEWTDSKGRTRKSSETERHAALGRSIALPFWQWLVKRISAQYERPATMGSLFDGISGFPLVWTRANGTGSVKWTSEIDEFPRAVCEYHFGENGDIREYL